MSTNVVFRFKSFRKAERPNLKFYLGKACYNWHKNRLVGKLVIINLKFVYKNKLNVKQIIKQRFDNVSRKATPSMHNLRRNLTYKY